MIAFFHPIVKKRGIGFGTDTLVGRATLVVEHSTTTYFGVSGVAAGASSGALDTVIDPAGANSLIVQDTSGTGDSGTIMFNGGTQIAWTRSDTDLQVIDDFGRVIHVDMSAIAPGFNGSVDFESSGTLSVDGGQTTVAIDYSASQTATDSTTGKQVHIDTREIDRAGDDFLDFTNTADVFQMLFELKEDLRNNRGLDNQSRAAAIDRRVGELNRMSDHLLQVMGQQSASLQILDELEIRVQDLQLEVETQMNGLLATNIPEAVLRMKNDQSLLEYTYAVTAQIASVTLIDFLR